MALGHGLAEGLQSGLRLGRSIRAQNDADELAQAANQRAQAAEARTQQTHERKVADEDELRALGNEVAQINASFLAPQQMGVQPPGPDGAPQPRKVMTLMEAMEASQQHMAKIAPLMTRILAKSDPAKAAEYAAKLADLPTQQRLAQEVAVGKLLLSNPGSPEARDAMVQLYKNIDDGKDIDPASWTPMENGSVKFHTVDAQGNRKPEVITPAMMRNRMMMGMTPAQIAQAIAQDEVRDEQRRHNEATEKQRAEELKVRQGEFGVRVQEARNAREERAAERADRSTDRKAIAEARERDEIVRGVDGVLFRNKDMDADQEAAARAFRSDTFTLLDMNADAFKGKGASVGARALTVIDSISQGKARVFAHKDDPSLVIVQVGSAKYLMPRNSHVIQQAFGQPKQ